MSNSIGSRVATAIGAARRTQKSVADEVGMQPDALSRALRDQRGLSAIELHRLAEALDADLHRLITGEPDPQALVVAARHTYNAQARVHENSGRGDDMDTLEDIALAYRQADLGVWDGELPESVEATRAWLGDNFVRNFGTQLEGLGVDVVRVAELTTAYSFVIGVRPVIALRAQGNWFRENWDLAHELGHLVLKHRAIETRTDQPTPDEREANAFAAELLLPVQEMRGRDWGSMMNAAELASLVWDYGVSVDTLSRRLNNLGISSPLVSQWAGQPTQRLLRRHWPHRNVKPDQITHRMDDAAIRRFPVTLQDAHLNLIAEGKAHKRTLAWMLGVEADTLEVDEPENASSSAARALDELLG